MPHCCWRNHSATVAPLHICRSSFQKWRSNCGKYPDHRPIHDTITTTMTCRGSASDVADLLARMRCLASMTRRFEDDQNISAQILQLSRELTATLQQLDEVGSLVACSVRKNVFGGMQDFQLISSFLRGIIRSRTDGMVNVLEYTSCKTSCTTGHCLYSDIEAPQRLYAAGVQQTSCGEYCSS